MLFLVFTLSQSKNFINTTNQPFRERNIVLYMNPQDEIEIEFSSEVYISPLISFKNLHLNIDLKKPNGQIISYGPFNHNSKLIGLKFINNIITLKFFNEGKNRVKFALTDDLDSRNEDFLAMYNFSIYNTEEITSQFIYNTVKFSTEFQAWQIFVVLSASFYIWYFLICDCVCACKCFKKN